MRSPAAALLAACLLLAAPARAELYRWRDAEGRVHFTQDLSAVPPEHRADAMAGTLAADDEVPAQAFSREAAPEPAPAAAPEPSAPAARPVYRIPVQRAGTSMVVPVRLNNSVTAPFVVDTGASDVAVPASVARRLGLERSRRTRRYVTANGVIEEAVVMLDTVQVGEAVVEEVPASISSAMEVGLLGLSFFNHFTYHVDAAAGVLTLVPNDLTETGAIRGGRSEAQWRSEFLDLRLRLGEIDAEEERTPPNHSRKLRQLDEARADLERQLAELETEADEARVPMTWRD